MPDQKPTFEQLMDKFQFHNESVHYHANIAQHIANNIKDLYPSEAKETGYFTDEFFENTADEEETLVDDEPQTSESALELH